MSYAMKIFNSHGITPLTNSVAHPVPYQGSKRKLAPQILKFFPANSKTLIEPFAGSAAISLAALDAARVQKVHLNDILSPLANLWQNIAHAPEKTAATYEHLWTEQLSDPKGFYEKTRSEFNEEQCPFKLLYLLARCVKNAVRFNSQGQFNQSADHRRLGVQPSRMKKRILGAAELLGGKLTTTSLDYQEIISAAKAGDLVYLDPPYQGTSTHRDRRYIRQLELNTLTENLEALLRRKIPFLLSFDGRCGDKTYGEDLPAELGLTRLDLVAGRSSQATLNGKVENTVESLYLSPELTKE